MQAVEAITHRRVRLVGMIGGDIPDVVCREETQPLFLSDLIVVEGKPPRRCRRRKRAVHFHAAQDGKFGRRPHARSIDGPDRNSLFDKRISIDRSGERCRHLTEAQCSDQRRISSSTKRVKDARSYQRAQCLQCTRRRHRATCRPTVGPYQSEA